VSFAEAGSSKETTPRGVPDKFPLIRALDPTAALRATRGILLAITSRQRSASSTGAEAL